jgi:hypothetical protein
MCEKKKSSIDVMTRTYCKAEFVCLPMGGNIDNYREEITNQRGREISPVSIDTGNI